MALTLRRWVAAAACGCALIWLAALLRPNLPDGAIGLRDNSAQRLFRPTAARIAARTLARTNDHLRLLEVRDSILQRIPSVPSGLTVAGDSAIGQEFTMRIEDALRSRWRALGEPHAVPVMVAIVVDSARRAHGLPRAWRSATIPIEIFLPSAYTNGRCLSVVHLAFNPARGNAEYIRQTRAGLISPETVGAMLGPCALLATFGEPGEGVRRWLTRTGWTAGRLAAWNDEGGRWTSPGPETYFIGDMADFLAIRTDPTWVVRRLVTPLGIGCLAGRAAACERAIAGATPGSLDSAWQSSAVSSAGTNRNAFYFSPDATPLGPADGRVLSEMMRSLGPDRFARFWRSAKPLPQAFEAASGTALDSWVREWARRTYGQTSAGPSIPLKGILAGVLAIVGMLAVALFVGKNRQVA